MEFRRNSAEFRISIPFPVFGAALRKTELPAKPGSRHKSLSILQYSTSYNIGVVDPSSTLSWETVRIIRLYLFVCISFLFVLPRSHPSSHTCHRLDSGVGHRGRAKAAHENVLYSLLGLLP